MNEIKCPNCGEVFTVNESQYAELLSQVRTAEFDKELHDRMKQELALAEQKAMNEQQSKLAQKDQEIAQLQSQIQNLLIVLTMLWLRNTCQKVWAQSLPSMLKAERQKLAR